MNLFITAEVTAARWKSVERSRRRPHTYVRDEGIKVNECNKNGMTLDLAAARRPRAGRASARREKSDGTNRGIDVEQSIHLSTMLKITNK